MSVKSVARASSIYLVVTIAEMAAALGTVLITSRYLVPAEYGIMLLITNVTALANLLFGYSLAQALAPLLTAATSEAERRATATTIIAAIAVVSTLAHAIIAVVVALAFRAKIAALGFAPPVPLATSASVVSGLSLCLVTLVRLREWPGLFARVQLPAIVIQLSLLVYFLAGARLGLTAPYLSALTVGAVTLAVYAWALRDWLGGPLDRGILTRAARIALAMLPWQLAILLATSMGGVLLVRAGRLEEAGQFAVASALASAMVGLANSFASAWTPYVLNRHAEAGLPPVQRRVFGLYSAGLMMLAALLALFAQEVIAILIGPAFRQSFHLVPPLILANSLLCFANAFAQGLPAHGQMHDYARIGVVVSGVFLSIALPASSHFGAWGLITAMAAAYLTMLVLLQRASERLMPVGYPWQRHGLMWLIAVGLVAASYDAGVSWSGLAWKAGAVLVIAALAFAFGAVRAGDVRIARELLSARSA